MNWTSLVREVFISFIIIFYFFNSKTVETQTQTRGGVYKGTVQYNIIYV